MERMIHQHDPGTRSTKSARLERTLIVVREFVAGYRFEVREWRGPT
jgi:hypothetical protein